MGNAISPCCKAGSGSSVKLIFYGGPTRIVTGKHVAGEIMFEFPDHMVCHADSFFIGQPIPSLAIDDELNTSQTYFILPIDYFPSNILTASSLATLRRRSEGGAPPAPVSFGGCPFEYLKGSNGRVSIRVLPDFFIKLFGDQNGGGDSDSLAGGGGGGLCSTPELRKHYNQLVGSKDQVWSPKLETITEHKIRIGSKMKELSLVILNMWIRGCVTVSTDYRISGPPLKRPKSSPTTISMISVYSAGPTQVWSALNQVILSFFTTV